MIYLNKFEIKFLSNQSQDYVTEELIKMIFNEWKDQYNSIQELEKEISRAKTSNIIPKTLYVEEIKTKNIIATAGLLEKDINLFPNLFPWLANVYVKKEYRGKGIGSKIIDYIINYTSDIGQKKIYLFTDTKSLLYLNKDWEIIKKFQYHGSQHDLMQFNITNICK